MLAGIVSLGRRTVFSLLHIGDAALLIFRTVFRRPKLHRLLPMVIHEIYILGVLSLVIMIVSALFIGMVVGLQGFHTLEKFASTAQLGQVIALTITRELGPVMAALLFTGRSCSALTAEIGLMKSTEQIDCMQIMGVDPIWRIISPRFWAGLISLPLLTIIFDVTAIIGGYWVGVLWLGVDPGLFWNNMADAVNFRLDVVSGLIKSVVFGFLVVWVAVHQGLSAKPTPLGVSLATTRTVVYGSVLVLSFDFILTAFMIGDW